MPTSPRVVGKGPNHSCPPRHPCTRPCTLFLLRLSPSLSRLQKRASHSAEEAHRVAEVLASSSTATAPIDVGLIAKDAEGSGDKSKW